jgi:ABC-type multidrug transport system fused ATPase/permease subunit
VSSNGTDTRTPPPSPHTRSWIRRAAHYLLPILLPRWPLLFAALAALVSIVLVELYKPWPLKFVFDYLLQDKSFLPEWLTVTGLSPTTWMLVVICAMILGLAVLQAIAAYVKQFMLHRLGEEIAFELRVALFSHVQRLGLGFHDSSRLGDIITRVTEDTRGVRDMATTSLLQSSAALASIIGFIVMMFILDWQLAMVSLLTVPLLGPAAWYYRRRIEKASRKRREREGELTSVAQETISSMRLVQTLGSEDQQQRAFGRESSQSAKIGMEVARLEAAYVRTMDYIVAIGTCAVIWGGVHRVWAGSLTAGDLVVFTYYIKNMLGPMRDLAKQTAKIAKGKVALERIIEVLELEPAVQSRHACITQRLSGRIDFENVTFEYKPGTAALKDVSFAVEPGQVIALVGHSGAGKSTILSLISRLYDPSSGRILLDGHDLRDLELDSLREQISVVLQESILFQTSIRENILYGRSDATPEQGAAAAAAAGVDLFIDRLPDGFDTVVGPRGATLSGGERQRVAIARAIVRNSPILILDEPTTGLDAKSEQLVMRALTQLMQGRTTLVVSHKLSLIERADKILVLDAGRIVESGTNAELLQAGGYYAKLRAAANDAVILGDGTPLIGSRQLDEPRTT